MAINLGGLARGVSAGLRDYALIKGMKRDEERDARETEKFGWEKKDRQESDDYKAGRQKIIEASPVWQYGQAQKQNPPPQAAGLAPMATAQNPEVPPNPADVATQSMMPGAQQIQPGARPPMAAAGLKALPEAPKQSPGLNDYFTLGMNLATYDVKAGKMDGQGLIGLANTVNALKKARFDEALDMIEAGDLEGGFALMNKIAPEGQAKTPISAQKGTSKPFGTEMPTTLVTYRNADGSISPMDVTQLRVQRMAMDKRLDAAQKGRELSQKDYANKSGRITAEAHKTSAGAKSKDEKGSLTQKDGLNVLRERFGGKLDSMGQWSMDDKNKDVAMRSYVIYQENLKTMEELPAAQKAADQAEREKATGKLPKTATGASDAGSATGTGKSGRDWKSLGAIP